MDTNLPLRMDSEKVRLVRSTPAVDRPQGERSAMALPPEELARAGRFGRSAGAGKGRQKLSARPGSADGTGRDPHIPLLAL
jgi:hypothetical protein